MNNRTHIKTKASDIFVKENLKIKMLLIKNIVKLGTIVIRPGEYKGAAHSICNFKYSVPKEIPIVFHNESNYDDHFIMQKLAETFEKTI